MSKVSVIIPVYNAEKYCQRCIDSIVNQTYKDLEIILVDDGSIDSSGIMCDEVAAKDGRVKVVHCENGGVSSARNRGLAMAQGEYVSFVDADDWLQLDAYQKLLNVAECNNSDLVYCDYVEIYPNQSLEYCSYGIGQDKDETLLNMLRSGHRNGNPWNFMLIRRTFLLREGILFPIRYSIGEDFWFALRCFVKASSIAHSHTQYYYDCGVLTSITHSQPIPSDASYLSSLEESKDFLRSCGYNQLYIREINYRMLVKKTIWLTDSHYFSLFRSIHPEVNSLAPSCPYLGMGMKLLIKAVDSKKRICSVLLLFLLRLKNGL